MWTRYGVVWARFFGLFTFLGDNLFISAFALGLASTSNLFHNWDFFLSYKIGEGWNYYYLKWQRCPSYKGIWTLSLEVKDQTQTTELTPHEMLFCKCYLSHVRCMASPSLCVDIYLLHQVLSSLYLLLVVIWSLYWNEISHSWPLRMSIFCVQFLFPTWSHPFLYKSCRTLKYIFII